MRKKSLGAVFYIFIGVSIIGVFIYMLIQILDTVPFEGFFVFPVVLMMISVVCFLVFFVRAVIKQFRDGDSNSSHGKGYFTDSYSDDHIFGDKFYDKKDITRHCPMCGSVAEPDQKFCVNCGYKLKD
ncbi:MAG TPA: zinc ribbon domain-containing protein [Clostridia bacterium]